MMFPSRVARAAHSEALLGLGPVSIDSVIIIERAVSGSENFFDDVHVFRGVHLRSNCHWISWEEYNYVQIMLIATISKLLI